MSAFAALVLGIAVVFAAVGWRADRLARDPSQRAGAKWGAVLFVLPFVIWVVVALMYDFVYRDHSGWAAGAIAGFGYVVSVGATLAGTAIGRVVHVLRAKARR